MNFEYTNEDLILQSSSSLSKFDKTMESLWTVSYEGNYFRYKIDLSMSSLQKVSKRNVDIFILPNCNRFNHRRKPQPFSDINDPITPESFNFNKVPTREILLNVFEKHNTKSSFILINVSPFSYLHSLFVPEMKECYNQVLRKQSLYSAVKCFLLSANRYLCMGFNSLLAHASVNHLHFHFWQSPDYLRAMSTEIKPKYENSMFFELVDHPVDNFVLELTDLTVLDQFMDHLWMLVMSCQQLRIAHNVFIARSKSSGYMRVVVWPRCSAFGAKNVSAVDSEVGFYVAVAELAGMLVVASEDIASTLNYDKVESILSNERLPENTLHILQCTLFEALRTT
ncbi:unnamed protein product [Heterobilharzia americana]|nr:unnamed protein product [Heterobilharzia americana]